MQFWQCPGEPSVGKPSKCDGICGDGVVKGTETCDDGSPFDGQGCNENCIGIRTGYKCIEGTPFKCSPICGDGIVIGNEFCDDGDLVDLTGCSSDCLRPAVGWVCSGGSPTSRSFC